MLLTSSDKVPGVLWAAGWPYFPPGRLFEISLKGIMAGFSTPPEITQFWSLKC